MKNRYFLRPEQLVSQTHMEPGEEALQDYLQAVSMHMKDFRTWWFGHWHVDQRLQDQEGRQYVGLYNEIEKVGETNESNKDLF